MPVRANKHLLGPLLVTISLLAGSAGATSYVGFGGGYSLPAGTEVLGYVYNEENVVTQIDTITFDPGWAFEAQFGWEANPWVDFEGALRYHTFTTPADSLDDISGYETIGFEGGVRFHPRRGFSNSAPYLRMGVGSYSPSIEFKDGKGAISNQTTLGYYAGLGYVHELSSKIGLDLRGTVNVFNAFDADSHGVELRSVFYTISLSLIIF